MKTARSQGSWRLTAVLFIALAGASLLGREGALLSVQPSVKPPRLNSTHSQGLGVSLQGADGHRAVEQLQNDVHSLHGEMSALKARILLPTNSTNNPAAAACGPAGRAMVIVEPRTHPKLQYVLENFDGNMPLTYDLYIYHGKAKSTAAYARKCATGVARHRRVFLRPLTVDGLGQKSYSALLTNASFWEGIDAEHILIFQTDTVLCSASPRKIGEFEQLAYVGCAYGDCGGNCSYWGRAYPFWGVGGLSLRQRSKTLECLARMPPVHRESEDVYYSRCVHSGFGRHAESGWGVAEFCAQSNFLTRSFGAHKPWTRMIRKGNPVMFDTFAEYCPEVKPMMDDV